MAAVVGPVGVKHPDFRDSRVSVLLILKIILDVLEILERHGKPKRTIQLPQRVLIHVRKSVKASDISGFLKRLHECLGLLEPCFPGIHRIDAVAFYLVELTVRNGSNQQIGDGCLDDGLLVLL